MEKHTFRLPLIEVKINRFPFVEGAFMAKNGKMLEGFFLIDTGSETNLLNREVERFLSGDAYTDEKLQINAVDNKGEECSILNIEIELDCVRSNERFCIPQNIDFKEQFGENRIIGIIGSSYLREHKLVLDYESECLCAASDKEVSLEDLSFACPMSVGLKTHGIPIVAFMKDGEEYFCVPDSGAEDGLFADGAFKGVNSYEMLDAKGTVSGVSGTDETGFAKLSFSLISADEEGNMNNLVEYEDITQVLSDHEYVANDGKRFPISALLSTKFMLRNKWILDYGNLAIYSRKQ